ncbi:MAG: hypothetical protein JXN61_04525, partial [Sedimentisphaerales bacterium]|nr:hypothetical protein [Sedimentisphaerales bacterium]
AVWVFQAWNMAYNISVTIPATQPDQRWHWVKNGYELLRDKAITSNPRDIQLYHELARIFQHKIGGISDDAHKYYKLQMALALGPLLGDADDKYFDDLVEAGNWLWGSDDKPDFAKIWQRIAADPNFASLIERLRSADPAFANEPRFISSYLALRQDARRFAPEVATVIDEFRQTAELKKFDILAKAFTLRQTWKLEPALMRRLSKTYGPIDWADPNTHLPLDWRHPDSHAIYWAAKGLDVAAAQKDEEISSYEINTDRIIAHSLQNLFRNGVIFISSTPVSVPSDDPSEPPQTRNLREVYLRPDLRFFQPYNNAVIKIMAKYKAAGDTDTYVSLGNGHRNMLKNALLMFYQSGHKEYAGKILFQLRESYPLPEFQVPLVEYARKRMLDELKDMGVFDAKEQIIAILKESYYLYAIHDDDAAFGREELARQIYDNYQITYSDTMRISLPEFKMLRYFAIDSFFADGQFSPYLKSSLLGRIEVERPDFLKQLRQLQQETSKQQQENQQP